MGTMNNLSNLLLLAARQLRRDSLSDNPRSCKSFTEGMSDWLFALYGQLENKLATDIEVLTSIRRRAADWAWAEQNEVDFPTLKNLREFVFNH